MKITIHRGTHEIGGSCVELEHEGSRLIIDIGMPIVKPGGSEGEKFDFKALEGKSIELLLSEGILPSVPDLYESVKSNLIDGILVSHSHQDHYGFLNYVSQTIPVYIAEISKHLINLACIFTPLKVGIQNYIPMYAGQKFTCGKFTVTPYLMDHDAFNAYAFHIKAGNASILYSGDFREHGRKHGTLDYLIDKLKDDIDVFLIEGTTIGNEPTQVISEEDVEYRIEKIIRNNADKIVMACAAAQNIDRLVSIYRAAKKTRRQFVIDLYAACVLKMISDISPYGTRIPRPSENFPEIRVFVPKWLEKDLRKNNLGKLVDQFKDYRIDSKEIAKNSSNIILLYRTSLLNDIKCIHKRYIDITGISFIYSMWEGYYNEKEWEKTRKFIEGCQMQIEQLHASGHAYPDTLHKAVDSIRAKLLIPVHTFYPELYEGFKCKVKYLQDGDIYII